MTIEKIWCAVLVRSVILAALLLGAVDNAEASGQPYSYVGKPQLGIDSAESKISFDTASAYCDQRYGADNDKPRRTKNACSVAAGDWRNLFLAAQPCFTCLAKQGQRRISDSSQLVMANGPSRPARPCELLIHSMFSPRELEPSRQQAVPSLKSSPSKESSCGIDPHYRCFGAVVRRRRILGSPETSLVRV
jgi:hypothetical protein